MIGKGLGERIGVGAIIKERVLMGVHGETDWSMDDCNL